MIWIALHPLCIPIVSHLHRQLPELGDCSMQRRDLRILEKFDGRNDGETLDGTRRVALNKALMVDWVYCLRDKLV